MRGWNFAAVPIKAKKQGFLSKFWNRTAGLFARVGKLAVNIATAPVAIYKYVSSNSSLSKARQKMQQAKSYDTIPGWNGALFDRKEDETAEDILSDQRRVPVVWSYMTAGRAEIDQNGKKVAAPPEVSIMVHQAKAGSSAALNGIDMGHVMLGISYTRYSNVTGRNQRYAIQYGFYPAGGFTAWGFSAAAILCLKRLK